MSRESDTGFEPVCVFRQGVLQTPAFSLSANRSFCSYDVVYFLLFYSFFKVLVVLSCSLVLVVLSRSPFRPSGRSTRKEGTVWLFLRPFRPLRVADCLLSAFLAWLLSSHMWWHRAWGGLRCLLFSLWHRKRVGIRRDGHRLLTATEGACVCAHDEGGHRIDSLGRDGGDGDVHRGGHFLWHLPWCLSAGPEPLSCPLVNSL